MNVIIHIATRVGKWLSMSLCLGTTLCRRMGGTRI